MCIYYRLKKKLKYTHHFVFHFNYLKVVLLCVKDEESQADHLKGLRDAPKLGASGASPWICNVRSSGVLHSTYTSCRPLASCTD